MYQNNYEYCDILYNSYNGVNSLQCTSQTGQAYDQVTGHVTAEFPLFLTPQPASINFTELYFFEYGSYPTTSELSSITATEAETWYAAYMASMGFAVVSGSEIIGIINTPPPGQLCFPKWQNTCYQNSTNNTDEIGPPFQGYVVFPDGDTCHVQDVSFADQVGTNLCDSSNIPVKLLPGCSHCK